MVQTFIGGIVMFGGNFNPRGWAYCDGQLLPISQNSALFSILGTTYGGDGRTTFGLPDLRGRTPIHTGGSQGQGPGLSPYRLGQKGGIQEVQLLWTELPSHTHTGLPLTGTVSVNVNNADGNANTPGGNYIAKHPSSNGFQTAAGGGRNSALNGVEHRLASPVANTGGNQTHFNEQPFYCVNYIMALFGVYPSRS